MELRPRAIRLDVRRIVIDGLKPSDRTRFARAFQDECARAFAEARFRAGAVPYERVEVRYSHDATPEAIARTLVHGVVRALTGR
jgi:hypothetical protein